MDPAFIEERRVKCEGYLRQLLLYPRVATIQEMHDFLGLPGGRLLERSVLFQPGSLGLKLSRQGMGASRVGVAAFNTVKGPIEDGGHDVPGPAEASGLINIGDSLTRVGGEDVTQIPVRFCYLSENLLKYVHTNTHTNFFVFSFFFSLSLLFLYTIGI